MRFENPPALPHDESEGILSRALSQRPAPRDAVNALVGMALGDDDAGFVERWCMRIADEAVDPALKGLAALCIGHVARRFGEVTLEAATTVVRLFADAEVMAANPQPLDALDDLDNFAPETLEAAKRQMRAELGGPLPAWFPCPCCGFLTLTERPPGTFDICPVCFWEDDNVQYNDPDYAGGANVVSPNQARKNFAEFGATERRVLEYVRRPRPSEQPG